LAIRLGGVHPYWAFANHRCVCNMNAVRSIEFLAAGDGQHNLFRTLGPTLLISMAYIDLGKWLVAVDSGSRFGYDLVLLVLLFNFSAILCQYLSTCIGMVTGKNLAEICRQEYSQVICVVLGLQGWVSLLTSEVTMAWQWGSTLCLNTTILSQPYVLQVL